MVYRKKGNKKYDPEKSTNKIHGKKRQGLKCQFS